MTTQPKGFSALAGIIVILVIAIGVAVGYYFYDQNTKVDINVNFNSAINHNINANQNVNASLEADSQVCDLDSDCEIRINCGNFDCYNKNSSRKTWDCAEETEPDITNKSCVCAEKECTLVEDNE